MWGSHPVAAIRSASVAPSRRDSIAMMNACLVVGRVVEESSGSTGLVAVSGVPLEDVFLNRLRGLPRIV